ncbi:MAG: GldG family protein [Gammaproteobacteria bacterium]|nr:GldG family protein [Gammaproteobacteria bacterium]
MEVTKKSRQHIRIQNLIFMLLFIGSVILLAWLTNKYNAQFDWTASNRNTLSDASIELVKKMDGPITITAFATESDLIPVRKTIREILGRYQRHKQDINLTLIDPNTAPDQTRELGISVDGELVVAYQGRTEHIQQLSEETITNTFQRLLRSGERSLVFISGHGERKPDGRANHDYGAFFNELGKLGIKTNTQTLTSDPQIPANTAALVIASPRVKLLDGEIKLIRDHVKNGGNLLWIREPSDKSGLNKLANDIGIEFQKGTIVDPTTQLLGIPDPSYAIVAEYPEHKIIRSLSYLTIFPRACGVKQKDKDNKDWDVARFLTSAPRSWLETGSLTGGVQYDKGKDVMGPLALGLAMSRENKGQDESKDNKEQRIVIVCDGDFLSNAFLGNQGNQKLGENIINWISNDDSFIDIPAKTNPDKEITLSQSNGIVIALMFLVLLPLGLLASGIWIWLKRRKQ